jgi:hypothetical protein
MEMKDSVSRPSADARRGQRASVAADWMGWLTHARQRLNDAWTRTESVDRKRGGSPVSHFRRISNLLTRSRVDRKIEA